ncbi:hypothetical protein TIFTF001_006658 [Ficus carica]|uniref:Transcription repressor n=1 Tax=Ficus carica TaxID=3494 RepID=A0AA87ZJF5_FICCA|nr:hypothetical protein TIFTF001_006658 [Ficus carica]
MPKKLQDYLFKIKKPTPKIHFPTNSFSSSKNWILSGCKHPKTLSFAVGRGDQKHDAHRDDVGDISAKLSDIDRFLVENFKSLYIKDDVVEVGDQENRGGNIPFESPRFDDPVPKLCGSNRFFVSPGVSGSLIEESWTSMATTRNSDDVACSSSSTSTADGDQNGAVSLPDDCVAVLAYSRSPYNEFRSSMQEVVEARWRRGGDVDWGFVEELLFSYLSLNDKKSHGHILGAFVDLVVDLRRGRDLERESSAAERSRNQRRRKWKRERSNVRDWS